MLFPQLYDQAARLPGPPGSGFAAMLIGQRSTGIVAPLVIGTLANTELFGVGQAMAVLLIPAAIVGLAITYVTVKPARTVRNCRQTSLSATRATISGTAGTDWNIVRKSWPRGLGQGEFERSTVVACESTSMRRSARATIVAMRWRPSCSTSTTTAKRSCSVDGDVPTELEDKARLAASNCPEYAITITD